MLNLTSDEFKDELIEYLYELAEAKEKEKEQNANGKK